MLRLTRFLCPNLSDVWEALAAEEASAADAFRTLWNTRAGRAHRSGGSFLYRDSIPGVTVDFRREGRSLLVPEPVGYGITFRSQIKGWTVSDVKSLELTLSGVVPEVKLVCGSRTENPESHGADPDRA